MEFAENVPNSMLCVWKKVNVEIKSLGFQQSSLWVFESNEVARNLYVGKGFQVTGLKRTDDRWKIPEIQMIKKGS